MAGIGICTSRPSGTLVLAADDGILREVAASLLGLLVTPSQLLTNLGGEIIVALALIFVARPVAVYLGLAPFRFSQWNLLRLAARNPAALDLIDSNPALAWGLARFEALFHDGHLP